MATEGLFRYAQLLLLYFMIASLAGRSARSLDQSCAILSASMVLSVFIGLLEFFLPSLALEDDDPGLVQGTVGAILDRDSVEGVDIKRITGGLSDSNWFAYTLAAVLPVNLYLFRRWRHAGLRLLVGAAAALQVFGIVLSLTRTAIFALAVSVAVLVLRRRLPLAPILAAAVIGGSAILAWNPPGLERLFSVQYLQEGSTPLRQHLLLGGVNLIADRPLQGYGYSEFGPAFMKWLARIPVPESVATWEAETDRRVANGADQLEWIMPHNSILQIWVEYGLAGIVSASLFVWAVLRDLSLCARFGGARARLLADCLAAAVWGFLVSAMFGHLAMLKIIWILAGLAAALRRVVFEGERAAVPQGCGPAPAAAAGGPG